MLRFLCMLPKVVLNLAAQEAPNKVGGQALIEGVMMRSKEKVGWAVKRPSGEVAVELFPFISATKSNPLLKLPIIRGAVYLFESFYLGYKALDRSAALAFPDESTKKRNAAIEGMLSALMIILSLGISVGLFLFLPMFIMTSLGYQKSALAFNIGSGIMRTVLFFGYLVGISFMKDVKTMFEYHGAEHKAIFTFEDKKPLTLENMRPYTTLHPRCGTSFLILVMLVSIFLFSCIDAALIKFYFTNGMPVFTRMLIHLALVPLVSGTSYEVLKASDKYQQVWPISWLIKPGLWLQNITTRKPSDAQLGVAAQALEAVL